MARDFLIITIGKAIQILLGIITIKISTEYLNPTEFGRMGLIFSTMIFLAFFLITPVSMYLNRFLLQWNEEGKLKIYFGYFILYSIVTISIFGIIASIVLSSMYSNFSLFWLLILTILHPLASIPNLTMLSFLNILQYRTHFIILTILTMIMVLITSIIISNLFRHNAEFWLLGQIIGYAIITIVVSYVFNQKVNNTKETHKTVTFNSTRLTQLYPILLFTLPFAISLGLNWLQLNSYKFILPAVTSFEILGLFLAGYSISAAILSALESIIMQYLTPIFYKDVTNASACKLSSAWTKYAMFMIPALIITIVFTIFAAPYLVKILLANSYQNASQFVIWGAIIEGFRVLGNCLSMAAHAIVNTKTLIIPNLIGAGSVLIGFLSLPIIMNPTLAICITLILGGISYCIALYIYLNKLIKLRLDIAIILLSTLLTLPIIIAFSIAKYLYIETSLFGAIIIIGIIGLIYLLAQIIIYLQWSKKYT